MAGCAEPVENRLGRTETEIELELPLGRHGVLLHRACHAIWLELCASQLSRMALRRPRLGNSLRSVGRSRHPRVIVPLPRQDRADQEFDGKCGKRKCTASPLRALLSLNTELILPSLWYLR